MASTHRTGERNSACVCSSTSVVANSACLPGCGPHPLKGARVDMLNCCCTDSTTWCRVHGLKGTLRIVVTTKRRRFYVATILDVCRERRNNQSSFGLPVDGTVTVSTGCRISCTSEKYLIERYTILYWNVKSVRNVMVLVGKKLTQYKRHETRRKTTIHLV